MALDQNLMGLGMPPRLATRLANGGTGPVSLAASANPGPTIRGTQFVVFVNSGSGWVTLPAIAGSDNAPELADDFIIHNGLATSVTVCIPTVATDNFGDSVGLTRNFTQ